MANEFARNIADASLIVTRALPTADGTVTSADIDLGPPGSGMFPESCELAVSIPALSALELPNSTTLTLTIQGGASATPTTSLNIVHVTTGTGSTIAEQKLRFRLPSNCPRYINVKFVAAGGTGDQSGKTATASLLF
jgi:hypothetical protein